MKNKLLAAMVAGFVMTVTFGSGVAHAQFGSWNPVQDIQREAQKVIDTVALVTAPVRQGVEIIQGSVPGSVRWDPTRPFIPPTVTTPQQAWDNVQRLPQTLENALNPAGTMLADAIRRAEARARQSCRPVPAFVQQALRGRISDAALYNTCFSTDWGATQNGTITQFLIANGYADAVTLNSVIVFKSSADALTQDLDTIELWAHELTHVEQYRRFTLDGFAKRYADDFGNRLEYEAEANASRIADAVDTLALGGNSSRGSFTQPTALRQPVANSPWQSSGAGNYRQPVQQMVYTHCQAANGWRSSSIVGGMPGTSCSFPTAYGVVFGVVNVSR